MVLGKLKWILDDDTTKQLINISDPSQVVDILLQLAKNVQVFLIELVERGTGHFNT